MNIFDRAEQFEKNFFFTNWMISTATAAASGALTGHFFTVVGVEKGAGAMAAVRAIDYVLGEGSRRICCSEMNKGCGKYITKLALLGAGFFISVGIVMATTKADFPKACIFSAVNVGFHTVFEIPLHLIKGCMYKGNLAQVHQAPIVRTYDYGALDLVLRQLPSSSSRDSSIRLES